MAFEISDEHLIPVKKGHAVSAGWPSATGGKPHGVTWHWTATWDLYSYSGRRQRTAQGFGISALWRGSFLQRGRRPVRDPGESFLARR